jgi:hypothetical protein
MTSGELCIVTNMLLEPFGELLVKTWSKPSEFVMLLVTPVTSQVFNFMLLATTLHLSFTSRDKHIPTRWGSPLAM